jgi:hypothetical protein
MAITIMLLAPSSHVLLCLTQFTLHNDISNLVSLITKTKLGLSESRVADDGVDNKRISARLRNAIRVVVTVESDG